MIMKVFKGTFPDAITTEVSRWIQLNESDGYQVIDQKFTVLENETIYICVWMEKEDNYE